uniref:Reverse transcriptase domain-containing protein n=1 Tax=Acrobeloides nanus TaxID=290746 RepID=A0A914EL06_9BILA
MDIFLDILKYELPEVLPNGYKKLKTQLGDIICGPGFLEQLTEQNEVNAALVSAFHPQYGATKEKFKTEEAITNFMSLETLGISENDAKEEDDVEAMKQFKSTIEFNEEEKRYYVSWPYNTKNPNIANNFWLSYKRLESTWHRLKKQNRIKEYHEIIEDQLARGIVEEVPFDDINEVIMGKEGELNNYLPHRDVIKEDHNTTKTRIVFDGSAHGRNCDSFNDSLYIGPNYLKDLVGILLRLRLPKHLLLGDLEKAFLMIGLKEKDRNMVRFLWLKDPNLPPTLDNIRVFRFLRLPFGISSSPFLLMASIEHHMEQYVDLPESEVAA